MSEGPVESASSGPGARLASARERAGLTLIQAAEQLHLDAATLRALEAGRFESLGAAVFVRGHLRRYAEMLGVPVAEIDAAYAASEARMAPLPDLRRTATPLAGSGPRGVAVPPHSALIGAIVVVLVALVWWAMRVPSGTRRPSAAPSAAGAVRPAPAAPGAAVAVAVGELPHGDVMAATAVPSRAPAASAAAAPRAAAGRVRLGLKFDQDSWAEVYDAAGSRLFYDLGAAGSERDLAGVAPLRIVLGNPQGVSLELEGRAVALGAAAGRSGPMRFALDGAGRAVAARSSPPAASAPSPTSAPSSPSAPSPRP